MVSVKVTVQIRNIIQFEMYKIIKRTNFKNVHNRKITIIDLI